MASNERSVAAGAAIYGPWVLRFYDFFVHGLSNAFAWRCPKRLLLEMYARNVSDSHLDVGVGSGYFLDKCRFPVASPRIMLVDLNPEALQFTSARIRRYQPSTHQANVLEPLTLNAEPFRSIAIMYLLHCLPGTLKTKATVFGNVGRYLTHDGVLFGATILGTGVPQSLPARVLMHAYNARGIFSNASDSLEHLHEGLERWFEKKSVEVCGCVALFEARGYRAG